MSPPSQMYKYVNVQSMYFFRIKQYGFNPYLAFGFLSSNMLEDDES